MFWYVHVICVGGLSHEVQCESSLLPLPQQEEEPLRESGAPQQESGCNGQGVSEQHTPFGMCITVAANCDLFTLLCLRYLLYDIDVRISLVPRPPSNLLKPSKRLQRLSF